MGMGWSGHPTLRLAFLSTSEAPGDTQGVTQLASCDHSKSNFLRSYFGGFKMEKRKILLLAVQLHSEDFSRFVLVPNFLAAMFSGLSGELMPPFKRGPAPHAIAQPCLSLAASREQQKLCAAPGATLSVLHQL